MNADGHAPAASSHITTLVAPAGQAHLPHLLSPVQDNIVALPNPPTHHTILQVEILFLRKMLKKLESITDRGGLLGSILANAFSENAFPCRHRGLQPPPVCCFGTHVHPRPTVCIRDDGSVCSLPFFQNAVFFKTHVRTSQRRCGLIVARDSISLAMAASRVASSRRCASISSRLSTETTRAHNQADSRKSCSMRQRSHGCATALHAVFLQSPGKKRGNSTAAD